MSDRPDRAADRTSGDTPGDAPDNAPGDTPAVAALPDARALEAALLARVDARRSPLAERLRFVVRGGSARVHLAGRLARARGALVGVRVTTLLGTALELLASAAVPDRVRSPALFDPARDLELRRAAARDPHLAAVLGGLDDGPETALRAARELVQAGLVPEQIDAFLELCGEHPVERVADRARALVALAGRAAPGGDLAGGSEAVFARASACLDADVALHTDEQVLLSGCDDARGAEADFVDALVRRGARVLLVGSGSTPLARRSASHPASPAVFDTAATARDAGGAGTPLARRAANLGSALRATLRLFAERLHAGVRPEDLALVLPHPAAHAVPLARAFDDLGVPFSAPGQAAPPRGAGRALAALARLLADGPRASAASAAAAVVGARGRELAREVVRRGAVALVDVDAAEFAALDQLLGASGAARPAKDHARALRELARGPLGFEAAPDALVAVEREVDALADALRTTRDGETLVLDGEEWRASLAPRLARAADAPLGGAGGGVQVLAPQDAHARAFDTLALVGFERGVFPRAADDDPLLDDRLRRTLRALLPDLDTGAQRRADDEALLGELFGAAPHVLVVHAAFGSNGNASLPAPALERLLAARSVDFVDAPAAGSADDGARGPLPPLEWARLGAAAAANAPAPERGDRLTSALAPLHTDDVVAAAHAASLLEHDRGGDDLGALGAIAARRGEETVFVTRLERHAICAWAAHLERDLRLASPPDGELVTPDARHVGTCVHRAVELLLTAGARDDAHDADDASEREPRREGVTDFATLEPTTVLVPDARAIDAALARAIAHTLERAERDGQLPARLSGAAAWLRARCRPLVVRAVDALFAAGPARVLGVERVGAVRIEADGETIEARFIADAALDTEAGPLLVDLKTGAPDPAKRESTRSDHVLKAIGRGEKLQAGAYAVAANGRGAYLFLGSEDEHDAEQRTSAVDAEAAREPLERVLPVIVRSRRAGVALPRLVAADTSDDSVPDACGRCDFVDACVQGDTLWRERQRRWIDARRAAGDGGLAAQWFDLAAKPTDGGRP